MRVALGDYDAAVSHHLLQLFNRPAVQHPLRRERMPRGLVPGQGRKSAGGQCLRQVAVKSVRTHERGCPPSPSAPRWESRLEEQSFASGAQLPPGEDGGERLQDGDYPALVVGFFALSTSPGFKVPKNGPRWFCHRSLSFFTSRFVSSLRVSQLGANRASIGCPFGILWLSWRSHTWPSVGVIHGVARLAGARPHDRCSLVPRLTDFVAQRAPLRQYARLAQRPAQH